MGRSNIVALMILEMGLHPHGFESAARALSECIIETSDTEEKGSYTSRYRIVICKGVEFDKKWHNLGSEVENLNNVSATKIP